MKRSVLIALGVAACACAVPVARGQEKTYNLSKSPKFRVGDKAVNRASEDDRMQILGPDGTTFRDLRRRTQLHSVEEVLAVDETGAIQAYRVTIVTGKTQTSLSQAGRRSERKAIALERIHFVMRRKGKRFVADTKTIASESGAKLKDSQLAELKEHFDGSWHSLDPYPDSLLMPAGPVSIGQSWNPSRKAMDDWGKVNKVAEEANGRLVGVEGKLVSVTDNVALVEAQIRVEMGPEGDKTVVPMSVSSRIDLRTGMWLGETESVDISSKMGQATLKAVRKADCTTTCLRGSGKASKLPAGAVNIGWAPAGEDSNSYKNPAEGFSLTPPKGFRPQAAGSKGPIVAKFANEIGLNIVVTREDSGICLDRGEVAQATLKAMGASVPDYKLLKRESLSLPGNVPAVLLTGTAYKGVVTVYTLICLDGSRVLSVSGGQPSNADDVGGAILKAIKTFRIFERDRSKGD